MARKSRQPAEDNQDQQNNQLASQNPVELVNQADILRICQEVANLIQQQQQLQNAHPQLPVQVSYFERFREMNHPTFEGGLDPLAAESWITYLDETFNALQYPMEVRLNITVSLLVGDAKYWWDAMKTAHHTPVNPIPWEKFKKLFLDHYIPNSIRFEKEQEFVSFRQNESMMVLECANKFYEFGRFCPYHVQTEDMRVSRFFNMLRQEIQESVASHMGTRFTDLLDRALRAESIMKNRKRSMSIEDSRARKRMTRDDNGNCFPNSIRFEKEREFVSFKQKESMTVLECANKFYELGRFCPYLVQTEDMRVSRFLNILRQEILEIVVSHMDTRFEDLLERALLIESVMKNRKRSMSIEDSRARKRMTRNDNGYEASVKEFEHYDKIHTVNCNWKTGTCFECGQLGHFIRDCPNKKIERTQGADKVE